MVHVGSQGPRLQTVDRSQSEPVVNLALRQHQIRRQTRPNSEQRQQTLGKRCGPSVSVPGAGKIERCTLLQPRCARALGGETLSPTGRSLDLGGRAAAGASREGRRERRVRRRIIETLVGALGRVQSNPRVGIKHGGVPPNPQGWK